MIGLNETPQQKEIADYNEYLLLKEIHYTNKAIANHLSYSIEDLGYLISSHTFNSNIEYQIQQRENDYFFNGDLYITKGVKNLLDNKEILEIYTFTQDLVRQHKGIDYLQSFYHVESDCKLFFIDQLNKSMIDSKKYNVSQNYCTLLLANEY